MILTDFLKSRGLDAGLEDKLLELMRLSLEWNEKINVTAIRDPESFIDRNIIDSLTICRLKEFVSARSVLDLGTGGGFPGLPLAVAFPDKDFLLMDSVGKKLRVVADIAEKLGLANVTVLHARAEDAARSQEHRECFDLVVSRAVAALPVLAEYCFPFVRVGGHFAAYKTEASAEEIPAAQKAFRLLGGRAADVEPDGIDGSGHIFVISEKISPTPGRFPRKAGVPSKDPL